MIIKLPKISESVEPAIANTAREVLLKCHKYSGLAKVLSWDDEFCTIIFNHNYDNSFLILLDVFEASFCLDDNTGEEEKFSNFGPKDINKVCSTILNLLDVHFSQTPPAKCS
jgi:hypothetical protein